MQFLTKTFLSLTLILAAMSSRAQGLPWKFGMTPDEVRSVSRYGPYKSFSNGDLETFKGVLAGREENFQFFFKEGVLKRIGVYLYEGKDVKLGAQKWQALSAFMSKSYGAIETPGNKTPIANDVQGRDDFTKRAAEIVISTGKTQMAPITQPKDVFVFSSFGSRDVDGK